MATVKEWLDGLPWWSLVLVSFAAGSALGLLLHAARRGKYATREDS